MGRLEPTVDIEPLNFPLDHRSATAVRSGSFDQPFHNAHLPAARFLHGAGRRPAPVRPYCSAHLNLLKKRQFRRSNLVRDVSGEDLFGSVFRAPDPVHSLLTIRSLSTRSPAPFDR